MNSSPSSSSRRQGSSEPACSQNDSKGCGQAGPLQEIAPRDAAALLAKDRHHTLLIDVRTKDEWDTGHVPGSVLVPLMDLAQHMNMLREHEDDTVLVICRSGKRSCTVATVLCAEGFSNVRFVAGGILRWASEVDPSVWPADPAAGAGS